jgi:hypothetical protein
MISHPTSQPNEHGEFDFHLKWKQVLDYWRENMASLKVFKMGVGPWNGHLLMNLESERDTVESKGLEKESSQSPTPLEEMRETCQRVSCRVTKRLDCYQRSSVVYAMSVTSLISAHPIPRDYFSFYLS